MNNNKYIRYALMAITVICSLTCCSQTSWNNVPQPEITASVFTMSPIVPDSMTFAGSTIRFDRYDMYERLDRELISFTFGHTNTLLTIKRANRYFPEIISILKEEGVPDDIIYIAAIESFFDNRATSHAKAAGIWQFVPATAEQYGLEVNQFVDERFNYEKATKAACKYFKNAYAKYKCWITAAASYNAGMGRISKELNRQGMDNAFDLYLNQETSRYIFRVLAMKLILEHPQNYGFYVNEDQLYQPIKFMTKTVDYPVDNWAVWAKNEGITYADLREFNPWIRNIKLPNRTRKTYYVRIPDKSDIFRSNQSLKTYNKNWIQEKTK